MKKIVKLDKTKSHQVYMRDDGTQCIGVTTAIGVVDDGKSMRLARAGNELGRKGKTLEEWTKDRDVGTVTHFLIECFLKDHEPDLGDFASSDIIRAQRLFDRFLVFWEREGWRAIKVEQQLVYTVNGGKEDGISASFGGTLDILAEDRFGHIVLPDIKTSKAIYSSHRWQVSAYDFLCRHANIQMVDGRPFPRKDFIFPERWFILRFGKDGSFEPREIFWDGNCGIKHGWEVFRAALNLYSLL